MLKVLSVCHRLSGGLSSLQWRLFEHFFPVAREKNNKWDVTVKGELYSLALISDCCAHSYQLFCDNATWA